jgi:hypothetical protein
MAYQQEWDDEDEQQQQQGGWALSKFCLLAQRN